MTSITDTLRLDRLTLRNFRCFAECTIELHPELTVLVAENGGGKTAILDATAIALGLFVDTVSGTRQHADFERMDVRLANGEKEARSPARETKFVADGYVTRQPIHWSRARKRFGPRPRAMTKDTKGLLQAAQYLRKNSLAGYVPEGGEGSPILPLVAFYGTDRFRGDGVKRNRLYRNTERMSGYAGCLSSSSSLKDMVGWYETKMKQAGSSLYGDDLEYLLPLITAVEKAMRVVLEPTGWYKVDWDSQQKRLIVEHHDQSRLPPSALSDGVRTMVALVMDIARRCFDLNPHLNENAARETPGILLIDEVDMHLHPRWQQQVVEQLRQAFPAIQMVLSTHSPQVLSTVDRESIRIIRLRDGEGWLETPQFQTRGVESADVLAAIMGVDPIPQVKEAQWLSNYRALIQQHLFDTAEAQTLRARLEEHFSSDHPVILECDRMIRLERFKKTLPSSSNREQE